MFDRLISLIGEDKFHQIKKLNILVIGAGGVGGYAIEGLIRCGVGSITIVDGDSVDITNINRQIIALNSTIGELKTEVLKNRLKDINPSVNINCISDYLDEDSIYKIDLSSFDYVVDACDDVKVKLALANFALINDIKLITSCGTAKKIHPELLEITTLDKTSYDPLARVLRQKLKDEDTKKLIVLSSKEKPIDTKDNVLGSISFVPSIGGLLIAAYIINDILNNS